MLRNLLSLAISMLIVSAASFAVAQEDRDRVGQNPRAESSRAESPRAEQDRPRDGRPPEASRDQPDRRRDGEPGPRGPRGPQDARGPRGEQGPGDPDGPFRAVEQQRQRLAELHRSLEQLQTERAEPERREQLERVIMAHERELNEMMRRMGARPGPVSGGRPGPGPGPGAGPGRPPGDEHAERERLEQERQQLRAEREQLERERAEFHHAMREREERDRDERHREHMERLEHLHQAAEHLKLAGFRDLSGLVMERIGEFERELRPPQPHQAGLPEFGELQDQVNDLRRAMHELGEQLQQIRRER